MSRPSVVELILSLLFLGATASASPCTKTQFDMLQWVSMLPGLTTDYHMAGNSNPLYYVRRDASSELVQIKGAAGYPWDVDVVDNQYIYQWITENVWNDPTTYKAFATQTTMPWMPRCIDIPVTPGKVASITVANPAYSFYSTGCVYQSTSHLGNVVNEVWGPYNDGDLGGSMPSDITYLELSYRYSCNSNYDHCTYKEVFDFVKDYGLARWTYYILQNGTYVRQNQTNSGSIEAGGSPAPYTPCFS